MRPQYSIPYRVVTERLRSEIKSGAVRLSRYPGTSVAEKLLDLQDVKDQVDTLIDALRHAGEQEIL